MRVKGDKAEGRAKGGHGVRGRTHPRGRWGQIDRDSVYNIASLSTHHDVHVDAGLPVQLVAGEVSVVGGGDEVVREWVCHILVHTPSPGELNCITLCIKHVGSK